MEVIILDILIGMAGALAKMIIEDGGIIIPNFKDGKLYVGGVGGVIVGAMAGAIANNDGITTFLAGYAGTSLIQYLVASKGQNITDVCSTTEQKIRTAASKAGIDPNLAVKVAQCESGLNPLAVNINTDGSIDRGLYQINSKYHTEVTEAQAFDPDFSIQFFITAFKAGNISWWNASKTCWGGQ